MLSTTMNLPKALQDGDEFTITANLLDDAKLFVVNFTADTRGDEPDGTSDDEPADIIYQFKIDSNKVTQNCKSDGKWMANASPGTDTNILTDTKLVLTFNFRENEVYVYSGDKGRHIESDFSLYQSMSNITTINVCGDIKRISVVTFRYA